MARAWCELRQSAVSAAWHWPQIPTPTKLSAAAYAGGILWLIARWLSLG